MYSLYVTIEGHERLWMESMLISNLTHEIKALANHMGDNPIPTAYRITVE